MGVLLVEDDSNDIEAFVRLAAKSSLNVRVTTASTPDDGWSTFRDAEPSFRREMAGCRTWCSASKQA